MDRRSFLKMFCAAVLSPFLPKLKQVATDPVEDDLYAEEDRHWTAQEEDDWLNVYLPRGELAPGEDDLYAEDPAWYLLDEDDHIRHVSYDGGVTWTTWSECIHVAVLDALSDPEAPYIVVHWDTE